MKPSEIKQSHSTKGILKLLDLSFAYKAFQWAAGDYKVYQKFLEPIVELSKEKKEISILDIGCGNGNIVHYLPSNVKYIGYDFNADYINKARLRFANNSNIKFILLDINNSEPQFDNQFDVVTAIGVLHHLDDEGCSKLFTSVLKNLNKNGLFLTIDPVYIENQNPIARFIISKDRGKAIRNPDKMREILASYFKSIEHTIHNNLNNMPYTHIITKCKK